MSAINVRLFRLYPSRYMIANVPTNDSGTAMLGMIVALRFLRKRKITMTTNATVRLNSNSTSLTDARIVSVRSVRMVTSTPAGNPPCNTGNSALIRSTTVIMFAPGWR